MRCGEGGGRGTGGRADPVCRPGGDRRCDGPRTVRPLRAGGEVEGGATSRRGVRDAGDSTNPGRSPRPNPGRSPRRTGGSGSHTGRADTSRLERRIGIVGWCTGAPGPTVAASTPCRGGRGTRVLTLTTDRAAEAGDASTARGGVPVREPQTAPTCRPPGLPDRSRPADRRPAREAPTCRPPDLPKGPELPGRRPAARTSTCREYADRPGYRAHRGADLPGCRGADHVGASTKRRAGERLRASAGARAPSDCRHAGQVASFLRPPAVCPPLGPAGRF